MGVPGASRRQLRKSNKRKHHKVIWICPFWELFWVFLLPKIGFVGICLVFIFTFIFRIAFGMPLAPIWEILESLLRAFWFYFEHFFGDAAKLRNAISLK